MKTFLRPLVLAALLTGCAAQHPDSRVELTLAALNDLHGYLEASAFEERKAGGVDALAATLQAWRTDDPDMLLVGAGDMIGASPAMSAMFADEPTIAALNLLGMRATSVGNHEFDAGRVELLRQAKGGCTSPRAEKACQFQPSWDGAKFSYLAANVIDTRTGETLLPAYRIEEVKGVKVAFIGTVLKDAPELIAAASITGLQFIDEAQAVNRLLPELRAQGATVFVVLIHQGGTSKAKYDQQYCDDLGGDIADVVKRLDPSIRLVVSGHSHTGYLCRVDGKLVTQAEKFGHMLSRISLVVDRKTGKVVDASARNIVVEPGKYASVPEVDALVASVRARSSAVLNRPVAKIAVPSISRTLMPDADESPLGQVVADALLAASGKWGAQIAFTNTGGIRTSLDAGAGNVVSVAQTQAVLPFGNELVVMDMTGGQIATLLEQQWDGNEPDKRGLLQVSEGFTYTWDTGKPKGQRIVRDSIRLHGLPIEAGASYRVAVFNFLAEGNDGFVTFRQGSNRAATGVRDVDALRNYLVRMEQDKKLAGAQDAVPRIIRIK
ncbi:bifunctional metallophosphatase/5'-nucleotidase [Pseudoduganella eburnea]|uniref:Bifunctional metallophosphatase/5'-nucleotidase n=1 Tax=Massilia eburnea TaxID=1776165 RepID=A0A6L6QNP6_9BURK|nr:bifunctional metallophosphatase/5'-nucleotidase [Massilia eburnea]MTW13286.1 bifunctional metallophosphatase/5'-nucleotidase [Massilia eburnea]